MDQQRGRSLSAGRQASHLSQSHSPSPQNFHENLNSSGLALGLNTAGLVDINSQQQVPGSNFNSNQALSPYNSYLSSPQDQPYPQNVNYAQGQDFGQAFKQEGTLPNQSFDQQSQNPHSFSQDLLSANLQNTFGEADFSLFPPSNGSNEQFDPTYFMNAQSQGQSINPADLMSDISSPQNHNSTPPNMLQPESQQISSAQHSPAMNTHQFQRSPSHSRHASLGPESAAFPQGLTAGDWSSMQPQFMGHRRTPSEYSDVSSCAPSPNLVHRDTFEPIDQNHSPLLNPQDAGLFHEPMLGIGNFSLSDNQVQNHGISPGPSPAISPRLGPQQMPTFNPQHAYMLGMGSNSFGPPASNVYQNQAPEPFPQMQQLNGSGEMGQAQQMIPPEINVEFAPASRQNSFEPPKPALDQDALTPPERGMYILHLQVDSH
jgi:hypothetical protein